MSGASEAICIADIAELVSAKRADPPADAPYLGLEHLTPKLDVPAAWGHARDTTGVVVSFEPGDVLFGRLRPYLRKVAVADREGFCSPEILVFRPRSGLSSRFLHTLLSSDYVIQHAVAVSTGSRMPRTAARDISTIRLREPETETIAKLCASVDALSEQQEALAGEGRHVANLRRSLVASQSAGCDRIPLGSLASVTQGKSLPKAVQGRRTGSVSWFKIADMTTAKNLFGYTVADTQLDSTEVARLGGQIAPVGSVVFPRVGAAVLTEKKRILDVDAAVDENHIVVTPHPDVSPEELLGCLELLHLSDYVQSGAVPSLNLKLVASMSVPSWLASGNPLEATLAATRQHARALFEELEALWRVREAIVSSTLAPAWATDQGAA